jgi:guanylate kinase
MDELGRRLRDRMTESSEALELRLQVAEQEMAEASKFSYRVVNHADRLDEAVAEVRRIIQLKIRRGRGHPI